MTAAEFGFTTISTGTLDAARYTAECIGTTGDGVALVPVPVTAQYPVRPLPGPRTSTWPGDRPVSLTSRDVAQSAPWNCLPLNFP